jgi:predicted nucleic acid-binding Zn finger protein
VQFQPENPEQQAAMSERQQDARAQRAADQEFDFVLNKDSGRPFCWCHSLSTGEVYETAERSCSCPDWIFRGQRAGIRCKHQIALAGAIVRGEIRTF